MCQLAGRLAHDRTDVPFEMTEDNSVIAGSPGQGMTFPKADAEEAATFLNSLIPTR
jgi:hypothetical protein